MELLISLSDVDSGRNERILIALLKSSGCEPAQEKYQGKANKYNCANWNTNVYSRMVHLGWEAQPGQNPNVHGQYHMVHDEDEICVVTPVPGNRFILEFPEI